MSGGFELSYERVGLDGSVRLKIHAGDGEPTSFPVDLSSSEDRERCIGAVCGQYPGLDQDEVCATLGRIHAEIETPSRAGLVRDTFDRARGQGLLPYSVAEAYRRAVERTTSSMSPWTSEQAAAALGEIEGAEEEDVVRFLEGDEASIRSAFQEGGGSAGELVAPDAAGMGALMELAGRVIPVSWEVSHRRSSGTGALRTPNFLDRLSLGSSVRRKSVAKNLLGSLGLDKTDEHIEAIDELLVAFSTLDSDTRSEQASLSDSESDATKLLELVQSLEVELFHTPGGLDSDCYAIIPVGEHREVWNLEHRGFARWASYEFYQREQRALPEIACTAAVRALVGQAMFAGPEHEVFTRLARVGDRIYLDLANEERQAIEVDAQGWRPVDPIAKGVLFARREGVLALPMPLDGGSLDELRPLVNVPSEEDWILVKAFLLMTLHGRGPYPILVLNGEQGCAKSFTTLLLRTVVDPSDAPQRRPPTCEEDIAVAGLSTWIVAYENVSGFSQTISDTLCCLSTGGSITRRRLYTNSEEVRIRLKRPVLVNGIENVATRGDFADRSIVLTLPRIPKNQRKLERDILTAFEAQRPLLLGALLDAVSCALRREPSIKLDSMERLAEFCTWVTAAEPALGIEEGGFMRAYRAKVGVAIEAALEASPVAEPLVLFLDGCPDRRWTGTCSDLLKKLDSARGEAPAVREWPRNGTAMSHALRRIAPLLRQRGIQVEEPGENDRPRNYRLWFEREDGVDPDPAGPTAGRDAGSSDRTAAPHGKVDGSDGSPDGPDGWGFGQPSEKNGHGGTEKADSRRFDGSDGPSDILILGAECVSGSTVPDTPAGLDGMHGGRSEDGLGKSTFRAGSWTDPEERREVGGNGGADTQTLFDNQLWQTTVGTVVPSESPIPDPERAVSPPTVQEAEPSEPSGSTVGTPSAEEDPHADEERAAIQAEEFVPLRPPASDGVADREGDGDV